MQAAYLQTFLLMSLLFFVGAALGCWLRRMFASPAKREVLPTGKAHGVEPLPGMAATAARPSAHDGKVERFERAIDGAPAVAPPVATPAPIAATIATAAATAAASAAGRQPTPASSAAPATAAPAATLAAAAAAPAIDNLRRIWNIDADVERTLHGLGVRRYADIAKWMKADVAKVSDALGFKGRIEQENWIEQAQILAAGGETRYTRQLASAPPAIRPEAVALAKPPAQAAASPPAADAKPVAAPPSTSSPGQAAAAAAAALAAAAAAARPSVSPPAPGPASEPALKPAVEERAAFATRAPEPAPTAVPVRPAAIVVRENLQRIGGINAEVERQLSEQGVNRYTHIAGWSANDIARFDTLFGSPGRIRREQWVEQAQMLAKGGETPVSREADRKPAVVSSPPPAAASEQARDAASRPARLSDAILQKQGHAPAARPDIGGLRSVRSEAYQAKPIDAAVAAAAASAAAAGSAKVVRSAEIDDLKRIRGVGVLIEKRLNSVGITRYDQVAQWTQEDIARVSQMLDFKGRIERENWVEQARILASGGQTEFSRRVDRGEVETSRNK